MGGRKHKCGADAGAKVDAQGIGGVEDGAAREVERAKVLLGYADGITIMELQRQLGVGRPMIYKCIDKASAGGGPGERFGGRLQTGHGHMSDPVNRFKHWERPIVTGAYGFERLEMCSGTLFMVKFINLLEADYPFADIFGDAFSTVAHDHAF